jgi:hypothetical protein
VSYAHSCKRYPKDAETLMELATGVAAAAARRGGGVGYSVSNMFMFTLKFGFGFSRGREIERLGWNLELD